MNERGPICKSLPVEATQQYGLATTGNEYYTLTLNSIEKPRLQTEPLPYKEILWKSTGIRKRNEKPTYGSYGRASIALLPIISSTQRPDAAGWKDQFGTRRPHREGFSKSEFPNEDT
ncbi:hypothetical protein C8R45DRAFT_945636 [Mycena sanguinolenta]|nr:hypothetical protein C8R45DRAFT_945636 [Mycena sanguinolenta]